MNKKLDLEFIGQPNFALFSISGLGFCALLAGITISFITWQSYQHLQINNIVLLSQLAQLNDQTNGKKLGNKTHSLEIKPEKISPEKMQQIQETVNALTTPWNPLLLAIEQSNQHDIALLSLQPNTKKQQILLTGEAKNIQSVLTYIKQLDDQPMLTQVYLQTHHIDESNAFKPVKFTIAAKWQVV